MILNSRTILEAIWPEMEITGLIGSGTSGSVFKAVQKADYCQRQAAVRILRLPADLTGDGNAKILPVYTADALERMTERYEQKLEKLRSLRRNPYIPEVEDFRVLQAQDKQEYIFCIRTELLNPVDYRSMDEGQIIRMGAEICGALEAYQGQGLLELHIHPRNILVSRRGTYKLENFGLAAKTRPGRREPEYFRAPELSEEMAEPGNAGESELADIYSLGLVMYWAANGCRMPFSVGKQILTRKDRLEALARRISGEPIPRIPKASDKLNGLILKACAYDPVSRYENFRQMRETMERAANQFSGPS